MTLASPVAPLELSEAGLLPNTMTTLARVKNRHAVMLGSLLLLAPSVIFAVHLSRLPAVVMLVGACVMIALLRETACASPDAILNRPLALPRFATCIVVAFAILLLGGEDHIFFANSDWLWRDSVLADVAVAPFPPTYQVADQTFFLRAPLGMYMLPALAARLSSLAIGHAVLLAQNATLLALALYLLATIAGRTGVVTLFVFLSFSGLDVIGQVLMWVLREHDLSSFVLPSHIESWAGGLQYSSVITQLFWAPNHALPAYWLALFTLLCARGEVAIGQLVVVLAISLFWSPFAFIGTLPLVAYLFLKDAARTVVNARFWLATLAAICFVPVAVYMTVDAARVPHGFIPFDTFAAILVAMFLVIEIPHAVIIIRVWPQFDPTLRGILAVSLALLIVLPAVRVGANGDLVMRSSIPTLVILAFAFAQAVSIARRTGRLALVVAGAVLIMVGIVTPLQEVARSLTFSAFSISDCNILTVAKAVGSTHSNMENYLARSTQLPSWLMDMPADEPLAIQPKTACWSGLPYPPMAPVFSMSNAMLSHLNDKLKEPPERFSP